MTPEQIKAIVKQADGKATELGCNTYVLTQDEMAEFVRLVREDAFTKAAALCDRVATGYSARYDLVISGVNHCATVIRSLK